MDMLSLSPYELSSDKKKEFLTEQLSELTRKHYDSCAEYHKMMDSIGFDPQKISCYEDIPFLPVSLFKMMELKSIPNDMVFKTLTSSGTTGQAVSKIYLDRETASLQQKILVKIVESYTGASRCPMLIFDSPSVMKDRKKFSARGAGILGFSIFGTDKTYALDDDMNLRVDVIKEFLEKHKDERILLFGFTFMIWQHFLREVEKSGVKFDFSKGIMIHGGGWKKLASEQVSPAEFNQRLKAACGLSEVHDYYGMVEQTGTIYMECECGNLHASVFSDVITRRAKDFSPCDIGEKGIIQVVSVLAGSYPGHSLLTEDEGIILGEDNCPCKRNGKYFKVIGRIKNAEIRGCSDTYAAKF